MSKSIFGFEKEKVKRKKKHKIYQKSLVQSFLFHFDDDQLEHHNAIASC